MKSASFCFILATILAPFTSSSQRPKKADRTIAGNIQTHKSALSTQAMESRTAGSNGEKLADDYLRKQFEKYGLKPRAAGNRWFQEFQIYDGKKPLPACYLKINNTALTLYDDYFPFAFSAQKKAEGAVAIALAESGYPWFKDLGDLVSDETEKGGSLSELVREKARKAAEKGATALILYNTIEKDLQYDSLDRAAPTSIPVIYLTKRASKKYCSDEAATLEVELNIALKERQRQSRNVVGFVDNNADSTIIAAASLMHEENVAALIELARLSKGIKPRKRNFLLVAYSAERNGSKGAAVFDAHLAADSIPVAYRLNLDSTSAHENADALNLVKQSVETLKTH